jgi:serine/threonine-protein kinase HipA
MTTSDPARRSVTEAAKRGREAYVWVWLPGATEPVVAGRLEARGTVVCFNYGRSYLERSDAVPLYEPELPLRRGRIDPPDGLTIASSIRDAGPDAWGQRVILAKLSGGRLDPTSDPGSVDQLTYLLESGSDRIGALDFQQRSDVYVPRLETASLAELQGATESLERGEPLPPAIAEALLHGSSIGGARPKVLLNDGPRKLIAKLSSTTDTYPVVKAEGVAMELARRAGLDVAGTELTSSAGRDALLVERFDRTAEGGRRLLVSALTLFGLDEMNARYATYPELADLIRARFTDPADTLRELFTRIVFNICIGNIDDHARNHAAFWDGTRLTLTPAYDLCPQPHSGEEAAQAMAIGRDGAQASQLRICLDAAADYHLDATKARAIIDKVVDVIESEWDAAADTARLTALERQQLWHRQILDPFAFYGYRD